MFFFLILFWRPAMLAMRRPGYNSRFDVFNSRLGRREFPVRTAREFAGKGLICFAILSTKRRLNGANRRNSRFNGKNRECVVAELRVTPRSTSPAGGGGRWPRST